MRRVTHDKAQNLNLSYIRVEKVKSLVLLLNIQSSPAISVQFPSPSRNQPSLKDKPLGSRRKLLQTLGLEPTHGGGIATHFPPTGRPRPTGHQENPDLKILLDVVVQEVVSPVSL